MPEGGSDAPKGKPPTGEDPRGERHPGGWRIRPGPDGRGKPPAPRRGFGRGFLVFFLVLLALNLLVASLIQAPPATRVRIPYSPTFLAQVQAGNVSSISSRGATVEGDFRTAVRYPNRMQPSSRP
jgi:cell division protease FtsH